RAVGGGGAGTDRAARVRGARGSRGRSRRARRPHPSRRSVAAARNPRPAERACRRRADERARRRGRSRRSAAVRARARSLVAGGVRYGARSQRRGTGRAPTRGVRSAIANSGAAGTRRSDGPAPVLARRPRRRVIAGTNGSVYTDTKKTAREIGRELGADYVLEGSVRWEKATQGRARVRVTPQLVSASDDTHLWAEVYEEPLDEIFRVQSDVARKVVAALDVTLLERERRLVEAKPTGNLQAYDYYLRGKDYM